MEKKNQFLRTVPGKFLLFLIINILVIVTLGCVCASAVCIQEDLYDITEEEFYQKNDESFIYYTAMSETENLLGIQNYHVENISIEVKDKDGNVIVTTPQSLVQMVVTKAQKMAEIDAFNAEKAKAKLPPIEIEPYAQENVDFDTFCKSDFRAVKVKDCKNVKKSDKLLQFTLDDGTGTDRQILSGIAKFYKPEELIGKTLVAITNLPPRKMMGRESCGMLISAVHTENGEEKLNLLMVDDAIPAGAKLG